MLNIKVENMQSSNNNDVPNQFIIRAGRFTYFQSYQSIIARVDNKLDKILLDKEKWDYSRTTGKYRNQFLGETKKETEAKIKSGSYKLVDLN